MNLLLSAYACEPNMGSEPGAGWHWGIYLAKAGHRVTVLTRSNNRETIEEGMKDFPELDNLRFEYYDTSALIRFWKKWPLGIYFYYTLWQIGAFFKAKKLHQERAFERVQHVTFATLRQPSFMGLLGIPFYFGPVGGGERASFALRKGYPLVGWLWDLIRDSLNTLVWLDPLMHLTFGTSEKIYVTSEESRAVVPVFYRDKTEVALQMGIEPALGAALSEKHSVELSEKSEKGSEAGKPVLLPEFRLLFAGRLLYWKGIHLGLRALQKLVASVPLKDRGLIKYTIIGSGPQEQWLKKKADLLGVSPYIEWVPYIKQPELWKKFTEFDVFLFPSLHDSGGVVVLETMLNGLPVVCLNLGGPGAVVDKTCGQSVETVGYSEEEVVEHLYQGLQALWRNPEQLAKLKQGACKRAKEFDWKRTVGRVHQ